MEQQMAIDQLRAADKQLEAAIEEMRRQRAHDNDRLTRAETNIEKLNDLMVELRDTVATKDDIDGLREDLRARESLHERLDTYRDRLDEIKGDGKHAQGMRVNWIVVALFVGELVLAVCQLYTSAHHG